MGYQPRTRTPRNFARRHEKARLKTKSEKQRLPSRYEFEEEHVSTFKEVAERTLNSLRHLGSQRFAVAPYYDHFDRWLMSLRAVLSEFESSPAVTVDDQFARESSQVVSDIELALKERRLKEISREEAIRKNELSLLEAKSLLARTEREYSVKMKQMAGERDLTVKSVATNVGKLIEELDRIVITRAGFLRGISKKAKAQKTAEASHKLDSTKRELAKIERSFASEEEKSREEHKRRKQQILEEITNHQKQISNLEARLQIDDALEIRCNACDALISALDGLIRRIEPASETTSLS